MHSCKISLERQVHDLAKTSHINNVLGSVYTVPFLQRCSRISMISAALLCANRGVQKNLKIQFIRVFLMKLQYTFNFLPEEGTGNQGAVAIFSHTTHDNRMCCQRGFSTKSFSQNQGYCCRLSFLQLLIFKARIRRSYCHTEPYCHIFVTLLPYAGFGE